MSAENDIYWAVWSAIAEGYSVDKFINEARENWDAVLHDKRKDDLARFEAALKERPR